MELIFDGNSEHVAEVQKKKVFLKFRLASALDLRQMP